MHILLSHPRIRFHAGSGMTSQGRPGKDSGSLSNKIDRLDTGRPQRSSPLHLACIRTGQQDANAPRTNDRSAFGDGMRCLRDFAGASDSGEGGLSSPAPYRQEPRGPEPSTGDHPGRMHLLRFHVQGPRALQKAGAVSAVPERAHPSTALPGFGIACERLLASPGCFPGKRRKRVISGERPWRIRSRRRTIRRL